MWLAPAPKEEMWLPKSELCLSEMLSSFAVNALSLAAGVDDGCPFSADSAPMRWDTALCSLELMACDGSAGCSLGTLLSLLTLGLAFAVSSCSRSALVLRFYVGRNSSCSSMSPMVTNLFYLSTAFF
jgi:hypothetical protein